ncbi:hypothetical protein P148_SR1C00001G0762 [candidate division SR1 bacterium RAAC1_SR1_1]|nr:hypothetical protein P148_SR1C00001G0762 [candidate division SR1 bacterium RAAC1_SR1_1]
MFKKIIVASLLISGIFITGCSIEKQNSEDKTTMTENQIFDKKKECANYKDKIIAEIEKRNTEYTYDGQESYEKLGSIFYSIQKNTCMYDTRGFFKYNIDGKTESRDVVTVYDYFSNEKVLQTPNFCKDSKEKWIPYRQGICLVDDFSQKLYELKGE